MMTVAQIATALHGEVVGNPALEISAVNAAECAAPGQVTFADNSRYLESAEQSAASAIIVGLEVTGSAKALIRVPNVRVAVAQLLPLFIEPDPVAPGVHPTCVIGQNAEIASSACIGPHCVVGARVIIGENTVLCGGNHIGDRCAIGSCTLLYPNVVLYSRTQVGSRVVIHSGTVIGSDGYGYVFDRGRHLKLLQMGNVVIEDDVEIGANSAIDRAAFGSTRIGAGTKIDNLVHVAHNVNMGKHCLVMGQAGFAGSTHLGDYCVIASQSGIAGHLNLGRQSTVGAKSGVMRDVADGETVLGIPAMPHKQTKRQWVAQAQLPEVVRRLRELEQEIKNLKAVL